MTILYGLAFLVLMVTALAGYGSVLCDHARGLRTGHSELGLCAAIGLMLYLALCGVLEFGKLGSPALFTVLLIIGFALWLARLVRSTQRPPGIALSGPNWFLLAPLAAGLALIVNSANWYFFNTDDLQGYLVYVERILQTGSTGADPFTYRRFESGLGASSYVYALGALLGDPSRLRIIDIGGGLLLMGSMIAANLWGRSGIALAIAWAVLVCLVAFSPAANMTPEIIGLAILYAAAEICRRLADHSRPIPRTILVALVVFAATSLKTTLIVPAACFVTATYATIFLRERRWSIALEAFGAALLALLLMTPWMVLSERAVETPLFPLFGAGRLSPLEAGGHASLPVFVKTAGRIGLLLLLPMWVAVGSVRRKEWFLVIAIPLCTVMFALAQAKYSYAAYRYGYSGAAALFLISLVTWLGRKPARGEVIAATLFAPILLLNLALYPIVTPDYHLDAFSGGVLYRSLASHNVSTAADADEVHRMQDAVPSGATLLIRIDRPYLLDFRRNRIFVMDWPGAIGPDAQMPDPGNLGALRSYLRRAGVDFVAYSYHDEAGMPAAYLTEQIRETDSAYLCEILGLTLRTQQSLGLMRRTQPVIFDDGTTAVMRLTPTLTSAPSP
jgi:hypothetical protein